MKMVFEKEIIEELSRYVNVDENQLEIPPNADMGDFALPCFSFAKEFQKLPQEIASDLASKIKQSEIIENVQAEGPYLNIFINKSRFASTVLKQVHREGKSYGSSQEGEGHEALIEHTSINPNASPHLGRTRNSLIGDSLARLYRFQGFRTEVHYYVNDIGKQIAMLVYACRDKEDVSFKDILNIYIEVNRKLKENPDLEKEIFNILHKLENGDSDIKEKFRQIVNICLEGQKSLFSELGIEFDYFDYESKYLWKNTTQDILEKLEKTGKVFTDEHGRKVLDLSGYELPMKQPVMVLTREDGTSLYGLRDIAYTIDKLERSLENNIVLLGEDHKLYFKQLSAALELLGFKAPDVVHYSFVLLKEGKMSTRNGTLVLLEDVMQKSVEKAKEKIDTTGKTEDQVNELAKIIGYGAVKFTILKTSSDKNVIFDWDKALNFEGDTAPYIQYTHARIKSIIEKSKNKVTDRISYDKFNAKEIALIKHLSRFPEIVNASRKQHKPHLLANFLQELAQEFNEFYHKYPVLCDDTELKKSRLFLVKNVSVILNAGLGLLGITAPDKM